MAHPVDVYVGQRVRQRRWMVGMTQQQLGDNVGIKFQQIQKYETGTNQISAKRMWDIAAVMEVPVSFFFEGLDGQAPDTGEARGEILTDEEALELVRAYYAIPENQRRRLFDLARVLGKAALRWFQKIRTGGKGVFHRGSCWRLREVIAPTERDDHLTQLGPTDTQAIRA